MAELYLVENTVFKCNCSIKNEANHQNSYQDSKFKYYISVCFIYIYIYIYIYI